MGTALHDRTIVSYSDAVPNFKKCFGQEGVKSSRAEVVKIYILLYCHKKDNCQFTD